MPDTKHVLDLALEDSFAERLAGEYHAVDQEEAQVLPLPGPSAGEIKTLVQTTFWASLTKEEDKFHDFRLVFMPVDEFDEGLMVFRKPLPFEPEKLAKIAPSFLPAFRVGVWRAQDAANLQIWGIAHSDHRAWPLYMEGSAGEIIVSVPSGLKGVITTRLGAQFVDPQKVSFVRGSSRPPAQNDEQKAFYSSDLREIAKAMRKHGHGGTLLVIPNEIENELAELIYPDRFTYECERYETVKRALESREEAFRDRTRKEKEAEKVGGLLAFFDEPADALRARESLRSIGQLTAADGATMITRDFSVLGFGAKIKSNPISEANKVTSVCISEPFEDSKMERKDFSELGWGTRHQSAAQFVGNSKESIAIVASQDGVVSFLAWDEMENAVRVIRHAEFVL